MNTSFEKGIETAFMIGFEIGFEVGFKMGIEKERREALQELLEEQFGPLSPEVLSKLRQLPVERLQPLRKTALKANSLRELGLES